MNKRTVYLIYSWHEDCDEFWYRWTTPEYYNSSDRDPEIGPATFWEKGCHEWIHHGEFLRNNGIP